MATTPTTETPLAVSKAMRNLLKRDHVGEVTIELAIGSTSTFYARAYPDHTTARQRVVNRLEREGKETVGLGDLSRLTIAEEVRQLAIGGGKDPLAALFDLGAALNRLTKRQILGEVQ